MNGAARLAINNTRFHSFISVTLIGGNYQTAAACPLASLIGPWEMKLLFQICNFQTHVRDRYLKHFLWNCLQVNATGSHWSWANIASSNDLMPSGNKPNELYMSQRCPRSISPYDITRWQCQESLTLHIIKFLHNQVADQWILHTDGQ